MANPSRPLAGAFLMFVTGLLFVAFISGAKYLGETVPAAQAAFLRYLLGLPFLIPIIGRLRVERIAPKSVRLHVLRGVFHSAAVFAWFYAMVRIPLAEVTAMNYLSPIIVTVGAAVFLGETLAIRRILAVVAALVGALIILRPGFREISSGHLAMLITATALGGSYLTAKRLTDYASAEMVLASLSITVTIGLLPMALWVWVPVSLETLFWYFIIAGLATAGHYTMTLAFKAAPLTVTQPVTFLQLVWSILVGFALFDERIDFFVIFGGVIIIAAISFITWRESVLRRRTTPPKTLG